MPSAKAYQNVPSVSVWCEHILGSVRARCHGKTRDNYFQIDGNGVSMSSKFSKEGVTRYDR